MYRLNTNNLHRVRDVRKYISQVVTITVYTMSNKLCCQTTFYLLITPEGCVRTFRYRLRQSEVKKNIELHLSGTRSPYKKNLRKDFLIEKKPLSACSTEELQ